MDEMTKLKTGATLVRHKREMQAKAFNIIRDVSILETNASHFLTVLETGSVATNVFLRRIHNFALDMKLAALADSREEASAESAVQRETRGDVAGTSGHCCEGIKRRAPRLLRILLALGRRSIGCRKSDRRRH